MPKFISMQTFCAVRVVLNEFHIEHDSCLVIFKIIEVVVYVMGSAIFDL